MIVSSTNSDCSLVSMDVTPIFFELLSKYQPVQWRPVGMPPSVPSFLCCEIAIEYIAKLLPAESVHLDGVHIYSVAEFGRMQARELGKAFTGNRLIPIGYSEVDGDDIVISSNGSIFVIDHNKYGLIEAPSSDLAWRDAVIFSWGDLFDFFLSVCSAQAYRKITKDFRLRMKLNQ